MARISKGAQKRAEKREANPPDNNWLHVGPVTHVEDYPDDTYEPPELSPGRHPTLAHIGVMAALLALSGRPRR